MDGRTISLPAAPVSAGLVRAQLLLVEPVLAEGNFLQHFLFLGLREKGNNRLGNAEAAPSSLQLALNPSYFRTNNPIWFTTLMFRSLEPFGIQSRHSVPSLSSASTPQEREAELLSHSQGTLSCSLICVVAV